MSMTMEKLPSPNSCFGLRLERNIKEYPSGGKVCDSSYFSSVAFMFLKFNFFNEGNKLNTLVLWRQGFQHPVKLSVVLNPLAHGAHTFSSWTRSGEGLVYFDLLVSLRLPRTV